jgi:hypothetical protein
MKFRGSKAVGGTIPSARDDTGPHISSPRVAYRKLVSASSNLFRSSVEFREKPRQIAVGLLFTVALICLALPDNDEMSVPSAGMRGLVGFTGAVVVYSILQSKDGLMVCLSR